MVFDYFCNWTNRSYDVNIYEVTYKNVSRREKNCGKIWYVLVKSFQNMSKFSDEEMAQRLRLLKENYQN